jgi:hypothetical protein
LKFILQPSAIPIGKIDRNDANVTLNKDGSADFFLLEELAEDYGGRVND